MQGKFQLVMLPVAGHAIQEDEPIATALAIKKFMSHFQIGKSPALPDSAWGSMSRRK